MVHRYFDVLIACPDDDKVTALFEVIQAFIHSTPALEDSVEESTKTPHLIRFKNGSSIKGKTTGAAAKKEGVSIRGKGANLVILDEAAYLAEADFKALNPIILGDKYKTVDGLEVRTFVASTPTEHQGRYFDWCGDQTGEWYQIHIPITENPDYTEEDIDERRALSTDIEWITEYLAEFLDAGMNAFKNSDVDAARKEYRYQEKGTPPSGVYRAMGVDWDKFQAGVNIVIVDLIRGQEKYKVIYREEVGRSEYTLNNSVQRIIALNEAFQPEAIYVDRGYGEHAVELLKLHGEKNLSSGLKEKVRGFNFNENVSIKDPIDGTSVKKQFKAVMLNILFKLFEEKMIEFPTSDKIFEKQLRAYKIIGVGSNSIKTTRKNEHIIDACGLACFALYSKHRDEIKFKPAVNSYSMPVPKVVVSRKTEKNIQEIFNPMCNLFVDKRTYNGIGRGRLSLKEPNRSKF
jgi:hypothetical protein